MGGVDPFLRGMMRPDPMGQQREWGSSSPRQHKGLRIQPGKSDGPGTPRRLHRAVSLGMCVHCHPDTHRKGKQTAIDAAAQPRASPTRSEIEGRSWRAGCRRRWVATRQKLLSNPWCCRKQDLTTGGEHHRASTTKLASMRLESVTWMLDGRWWCCTCDLQAVTFGATRASTTTMPPSEPGAENNNDG